ncbi:hypothetical protein V8F33_012201 [Rhypophila sp. PSN 637]
MAFSHPLAPSRWHRHRTSGPRLSAPYPFYKSWYSIFKSSQDSNIYSDFVFSLSSDENKVSILKQAMDQRDRSATAALLEYLYQDLSRISEIASKDIVLHPADRDLSSPSKQPLKGIESVQAHEDALIAATGGTLFMEVQSIEANEHFGAVLGVLRATKSGRHDLAIPFCGLWRFQDGKAVEHWENAADPRALARWLTA